MMLAKKGKVAKIIKTFLSDVPGKEEQEDEQEYWKCILNKIFFIMHFIYCHCTES
jgi:hypothetical protein